MGSSRIWVVPVALVFVSVFASWQKIETLHRAWEAERQVGIVVSDRDGNPFPNDRVELLVGGPDVPYRVRFRDMSGRVTDCTGQATLVIPSMFVDTSISGVLRPSKEEESPEEEWIAWEYRGYAIALGVHVSWPEKDGADFMTVERVVGFEVVPTFEAFLHYQDGTVRNVTRRAIWSASNTSFAIEHGFIAPRKNPSFEHITMRLGQMTHTTLVAYKDGVWFSDRKLWQE